MSFSFPDCYSGNLGAKFWKKLKKLVGRHIAVARENFPIWSDVTISHALLRKDAREVLGKSAFRHRGHSLILQRGIP
jgi:hypothetical protein